LPPGNSGVAKERRSSFRHRHVIGLSPAAGLLSASGFMPFPIVPTPRESKETTMQTYLKTGGILLAATALAGGLLVGHPALAQDAGQLQAIQRQIQQLQAQLKQLQTEAAQRDAEVKAARAEAAQARTQAAQQAPAAAALAALPPGTLLVTQPPVAPGKPNGSVTVGGVTITLGGFVEGDVGYRSRNMTSDTTSALNSIPFRNSPNAHTSEFHETARNTRLSLLASASPWDDTLVQAYVEGDLNGSGTTSNNNQSNSYTPRLRQAYMTYKDSDLGYYVLAGQSWSLLTPFKSGLTPRSEATPLTIDGNNMTGWQGIRAPELRVVKTFGSLAAVGLALDEPETLYSSSVATGGSVTGAPAGTTGTVTYTNTGTNSGLLNTGANYSIDVAPDVIAKAAFDPLPQLHVEVDGIARFMKSHVSYYDATTNTGSGHDSMKTAGGGGGSFYAPVIPGKLELVGDVLAGAGIGRYNYQQLPDATIGPDGDVHPLKSIGGMVGVIGHPIAPLDLYTYAGEEQVARDDWKVGSTYYGYGIPSLDNVGCNVEGAPSATCNAVSQKVDEITVGGWWRFLQGSYGTLQAGAQYEWAQRVGFRGSDGTTATNGQSAKPVTDVNIVWAGIRYTPFQ
jgi:outer membrane murein-binding lipoprotein Lpp